MIEVLGIKITDRIKEAGLTQAVLSEYASDINARLGFHEVTDDLCSREACIILVLDDKTDAAGKMTCELAEIGGIDVREMIFSSKEEVRDTGLTAGAGADIIGILVQHDRDTIASVQRLLTSYGCNIRTRLGVNGISLPEPAGLIILELKGEVEQRIHMERDLKTLNKVMVRSMIFDHL
jgi:hypothetical protein